MFRLATAASYLGIDVLLVGGSVGEGGHEAFLLAEYVVNGPVIWRGVTEIHAHHRHTRLVDHVHHVVVDCRWKGLDIVISRRGLKC